MEVAKQQVYKCKVCGLVVEVVAAGSCVPSCCGQPMTLMAENTQDASREKHVPVVQVQGDGILVKVGEAPHPMEPDHYIEWIELMADGVSHIAFLNPGDAPEAEFCVKADKVTAREFCNKHGLWKAEFQG